MSTSTRVPVRCHSHPIPRAILLVAKERKKKTVSFRRAATISYALHVLLSDRLRPALRLGNEMMGLCDGLCVTCTDRHNGKLVRTALFVPDEAFAKWSVILATKHKLEIYEYYNEYKRKRSSRHDCVKRFVCAACLNSWLLGWSQLQKCIVSEAWFAVAESSIVDPCG